MLSKSVPGPHHKINCTRVWFQAFTPAWTSGTRWVNAFDFVWAAPNRSGMKSTLMPWPRYTFFFCFVIIVVCTLHDRPATHYKITHARHDAAMTPAIRVVFVLVWKTEDCEWEDGLGCTGSKAYFILFFFTENIYLPARTRLQMLKSLRVCILYSDRSFSLPVSFKAYRRVGGEKGASALIGCCSFMATQAEI